MVSSLAIGVFVSVCTCLGLLLLRYLPRSDRARGLATMAAAGLALFIVIEVGSQALGTVELLAMGGSPLQALFVGVLLIMGLLTGMVVLAWIETRRGQPGADQPQPLDVAVMLAAGIGLHDFAAGVGVGHTVATALAGPGFVFGVAFHGLAHGAAVAAPVAGQPMSAIRLLTLLVIAAGPSLAGIVLGTAWVGPGLEQFCLSVAAGTLIYVLRELFRARFESMTTVAAMGAVALGLLVGLGSQVLVESGRARMLPGFQASSAER
jgi:ZIP family zinc transporter